MILACSLPWGGWSPASWLILVITVAVRPCRMSSAWALTQSSMAGSRGWWKHQAAFHRYSSTWMKSTRMVMVMPRAAAWSWTRASWWMSPSTRTIRVRWWPGSRRPASSKTLPMVTSRLAVMSQAYQRFTARGAAGRARGGGWGGVEDAAVLGHPLMSFLPAAPPVLEGLCPRVRGLGAAAAGLGPHRHALAVRRDRQRRQVLPGLPGPGQLLLVPRPVLAEPLRVCRSRQGDLLQLPLADADPRDRQHELARLLIRARPAEHLRQLLQRPGVPARRQVQHRITREQRPRAPHPGPVTDPPHHHRAQPGHHRPGMPTLGASPPHPVRAAHLRQPDLPLSLGVQAQLDQPPQQVPALLDDQQLHRVQRHRPGRLHRQPRQPIRQRPQPGQHQLRARRQPTQPVLFHQRLPFRGPGLRTSGPYGTEASPTPSHAPATSELTPKEPHPCGNHVVARVTADGSGGNGEEGGAGAPGEVLMLTPRGPMVHTPSREPYGLKA